MTPLLILNVEEDHLLPVAVCPDGRVLEYKEEGDNRIWLYFYSDGTSVDNALKYKSKCLIGTQGYYGNVLRDGAAGKTAAILGQELPAFDLFRITGVLKKIDGMYKDGTGDKSPRIPVYYVFAESIENDVRKAFISYLMKFGFEPVSYTCQLTEPLVIYAGNNKAAEYSFGDYMVLITSAGDSLRVTTAVYDGETWMSDGRCKMIDGIGDAPLKAALVKSVVTEVDKHNGYLVNDAKFRAEVLNQMHNSEDWYELYKKGDGDFSIGNFAYTMDPSVRYSCTLSRSLLDAIFEDTVNRAMTEMSVFVKDSVGRNSVKLAIMSGPAFDDEKFASMVRASLGNPPFLCVQSYAMPEVLKNLARSDIREDFKDFDSLMHELDTRRPSVTAWIAAANRTRALWKGLEEAVPMLAEAVEKDDARLGEMMRLCDIDLSHSQFDKAKDKLVTYSLPGDEVSSAKSSISELMNTLDELQVTFQSIVNIEGARKVIFRIHELGEQATTLIKHIAGYPAVLKEKMEQIKFFESHYDEYLGLMKQFRRATGMKLRRELVEKMSGLTMEELPALKLDPVNVELNGRIEVEKSGLFGLKKSRRLVFGMRVLKEAELPCRVIVDVSCESQICANEGDTKCIAFTLDKGLREWSSSLQLPDSRLNDKDNIKIYMFAAPDVLDPQCIKANYVIVKQK